MAPRSRFYPSIKAYLAANVRKVRKTGCWIWTGYLHPSSGYGRAHHSRRQMFAHRASYETHHGPIPRHAFVLHRCDVKRCINPDHLFLGSQADNVSDMVHKNRNAKGVDHGAAVLTEEQVRSIRRIYAEVKISQKFLGQRFSVSRETVKRIVRRETWRHVA